MEEETKQKQLGNKKKIEKILALAKNEADAPIGYYVIDRLCDALNLPVPSVKSVVERLREEGFQASLTIFNPKGIRSNASAASIKGLVEEIVKTGR
jgi:tRNA (guanine26-N2/guanine27-N2)-dimethyltransferase